jgi:hypothetical protein
MPSLRKAQGLTLEGIGSRSVRPAGECWGTPGHDLGDSSGQHRSPTDRSDQPLTCANTFILDPAGRHTVYGMQEVRADAEAQVLQGTDQR